MIFTHERRIGLLALLGALPAVTLALVLLWGSPYSLLVRTALTRLIVGAWIGAARTMRDRMLASPLLRDVPFTRNLEALYAQVHAHGRAATAAGGA